MTVREVFLLKRIHMQAGSGLLGKRIYMQAGGGLFGAWLLEELHHRSRK